MELVLNAIIVISAVIGIPYVILDWLKVEFGIEL